MSLWQKNGRETAGQGLMFFSRVKVRVSILLQNFVQLTYLQQNADPYVRARVQAPLCEGLPCPIL